MTRIAAAVLLAAFALPAATQHQPYAGQHERDIKALSDEEVKQYLTGAGLGYAKSAELNRYPGPSHALGLAVEQLFRSRDVQQQALAEAVAKAAALEGEYPISTDFP
jgi:hypothetical protein